MGGDNDPETLAKLLSISQESLAKFLGERHDFLDGIVVSGGEPTLSVGLSRLLQKIRAHGYKIKLDTNGSRPKVLQDLLGRNLLDFVALDIKAPLVDPEFYARICGLPGKLGQPLW